MDSFASSFIVKLASQQKNLFHLNWFRCCLACDCNTIYLLEFDYFLLLRTLGNGQTISNAFMKFKRSEDFDSDCLSRGLVASRSPHLLHGRSCPHFDLGSGKRTSRFGFDTLP